MGFYLSESGEPKSHTSERPFTVASLAAIDIAGKNCSTYRIPTGGTEGCFNDLHNARLVTLYLWISDSAVSCLLGFLQSQHCSASGTLSALCEDLCRTNSATPAPPGDSLRSPTPWLAHPSPSNGSACRYGGWSFTPLSFLSGWCRNSQELWE